MLNERYTSGHLTKVDESEDIDDSDEEDIENAYRDSEIAWGESGWAFSSDSGTPRWNRF